MHMYVCVCVCVCLCACVRVCLRTCMCVWKGCVLVRVFAVCAVHTRVCL